MEESAYSIPMGTPYQIPVGKPHSMQLKPITPEEMEEYHTQKEKRIKLENIICSMLLGIFIGYICAIFCASIIAWLTGDYGFLYFLIYFN